MADAITMRNDILRAMYVGTKQVFMRNLKKQPEEQWKSYMTVKNSESMEEKYDSIGNMKEAEVKDEGASIEYGNIIQGYQTTVKNETVANGFAVTLETTQDEKWGVVPEVKVNELIRTMISKRENSCAEVWDNVTTAVGADGVPYASHTHPLLNNTTLKNDNLVEDEFNIDSYELANQRFNHWYNHTGDKFFTTPSAMLAHRDRQTYILAMLNSMLKPFENTNTKNTIPQLKLIFSVYINNLKVHILDESIESAIFQRRFGIESQSYYDAERTFNWYFNVFERYKAAMINPGFGFVTITGESATP